MLDFSREYLLSAVVADKFFNVTSLLTCIDNLTILFMYME